MRPFEWALMQSDLCPYEKRKCEQNKDTRNVHREREQVLGAHGEDGSYKPRRGASEETSPAGTGSCTSSLQNCETITTDLCC